MIRREFPDDAERRQFAYTNGIEIARAVGDNKPLRFQLQALKNWEVRQAAINAGIDLGERHVGSRQGLGEAQIGRQELFRQMLERGVKPEDIPGLAKPPEGSWQFTKPMKMYRAVRKSLEVLHHELGHVINAGWHDIDQLGVMSHHHPNAPSGSAAAAVMDQTKWLDENGDWDPVKAAPDLDKILEIGAGGIAANEVIDRVPRNRNAGGRGDRAAMEQVMDAVKIPRAEWPARIDAAIDRAAERLRPIADMIRDEASRREDNLRIDWHFSQRRAQNIVERAKREALEAAGQQPLWDRGTNAPTGGGGAAQGAGIGQGPGAPGGGPPAPTAPLKRFVPPKVEFTVAVQTHGSFVPRVERFKALNEGHLQQVILQKYPTAVAARILGERPLKPVGPVALPYEAGESPLKDMVSEEDVEGRARREERRAARAATLGMRAQAAGRPAPAILGTPETPTTVTVPHLETGKTGTFGPQTIDQRVGKWQSQMTPEQITQWRNWYPEVRKSFQTWFGDNMRKLGAWALSQKNTSPSTGFMNLQRTEDVMQGYPRVLHEVVTPEGKEWRPTSGGMAEDQMREMLQGEVPEKGAAAKLHDFLDSILGKLTRTWMGDRPEFGQPAAVDIHGGRGAGFVDQKLVNAVKEQYGPEAAAQLKVDFKGSLSEAQYAYASKMFNDVAQELNRRNYMGGNWTASQVQAVDWAATGMQIGRNMELPSAIFDQNTRRIAYEVNPNANSPIGRIAPWDALTPEMGRLVTHDTAEHAVRIAMREAGGMVAHKIYGMGGWMDFFSPSARLDVLGSPEAAERAGLVLGYLLGQEEVLIVRPRIKGGNGHVFEITEKGSTKLSEPAVVEQYWQEFRKLYPEAEGFMPTRNPDGTVGISIARKNGHFNADQIARLKDAAVKAGEIVGLDEIDGEESPAEVYSIANDWERNPNGEQFLRRLGEIGKPGIIRRMEGYARQVQRTYIDAYQRAITRTREGP